VSIKFTSLCSLYRLDEARVIAWIDVALQLGVNHVLTPWRLLHGLLDEDNTIVMADISIPNRAGQKCARSLIDIASSELQDEDVPLLVATLSELR
jgi:hypothetical protein